MVLDLFHGPELALGPEFPPCCISFIIRYWFCIIGLPCSREVGKVIIECYENMRIIFVSAVGFP